MNKKDITAYLKTNRNVRRADDNKGFVIWDRLLDLTLSDRILELCFWETGLDFIADLENVIRVDIGDESLSISCTGGHLILHRDDCDKVKDALLRG